ncbi:MAG: bifunctional acetate--CoA ligase family protein/GNAT family N-acetyltransferase [Anaerolineae bacterium]|nr:bifunctional acetate--CoA ligase family protein/GNAT family N-acetyltransferase [Anaerolineae bacterium]
MANQSEAHPRRHSLDPIFNPKNVAVIGATERENSVGHKLMLNLSQGALAEKLYPVNLKRKLVLGRQTYRSIKDIPEPIDLAVIATPAKTVPKVIRDCVQAKTRGAIIISTGFREMGAAGAGLEEKILAEARQGDLRIIGPNCLGVMNPVLGLNAALAPTLAAPGHVAFISQSGAFGAAILDWSKLDTVGFSAFVSVGSMLDVNWGDLITYFGKDYRTKSIVIYMESVGEARSFLSAAREVTFNKPVIVLKPGRTEAAAQAAASHTGALTGSDEVLDAAFRRSGIVRVDRVADLFYMSEVLDKQARPRGPRLTIISNAGGPGVLSADSLQTFGAALADLTPETLAALDAVLPEHWSHNNPIDILDDADPDRYAQTLEIAVRDPNSDGTLLILAPQDLTDPSKTAQVLAERLPKTRKPIIASWMGGADVAEGAAILNQANIPTFDFPDMAIKVFSYMWQYTHNLRSLYETPTLPPPAQAVVKDRERVGAILTAVRQKGRILLTELESKLLLAAYGIPTVETRLAADQDEAVALAEKIGYPVVVKLNSETISHKSDVRGVRLNLVDAEAVREAYRAIEAAVAPTDFQGVTVQPMVSTAGYELIVGSSIDAQFGPVLLFGLGGELVEVFQDRALGLPPLTSTLARRMMQQTKIYTALQGVRGRGPVDVAALEQLLVRFSHLVLDQAWIKEIEINPLLASAESLLALDARVVLHPPDMAEADLPKPAIRPYPRQYVESWQLKDGRPVTIRPIRAEDEPLMAKFHETLSDESVYSRFFRYMPLSRRIAHERLSRICFVDYDVEIALVVEYQNPATGEPELFGVGRLIKLSGTNNEAEFSVMVREDMQGEGLGTKILRSLVQVGRQEKVRRIVGTILPENYGMQHVARKAGFEIKRSIAEGMVIASLLIETPN